MLSLMASGAIDAKPMVTHRFPLADLQAALDTALDRLSGSIKVVLTSGPEAGKLS